MHLRSAITGMTTSLGEATISNVGGTLTRGNYRFEIFKTKDDGSRMGTWKTATVGNFPRKTLLGWDLLFRCLKASIGERNGAGSGQLPLVNWEERAIAAEEKLRLARAMLRVAFADGNSPGATVVALRAVLGLG